MDLEMQGITKRFGDVVANDSVDLTLRGGRIVALVGENGAGKSTLMNILYGLYRADEGEILIDGQPVEFDEPADAIAAGIGMVHQHFMLVPVFTVTENVVLGVEPVGRFGSLDLDAASNQVRSISERYGLAVDPDAKIEDLAVGVQQRVEIIKVLFREAQVLVFDEPTAVLTPQEVEHFFEVLTALRDSGRAIVFITHKLKEALEIADDIAVLRRGAIVGTAVPGEVTELELAELMVGRPVDLEVDKAPASPGGKTLEVRDLLVIDEVGKIAVDHVTFEVAAGEIVGIAGVQGNGQTELVEALTGMRPVEAGEVRLDGRDVTAFSPREKHRAGVAHIPEDRQGAGLVMPFTITENTVLDSYYDEPLSHGLRMDWAEARRRAEQLTEQYDVRLRSLEAAASTLSGGNQQKLIVARELDREVALTIAAQPTRGVDVGSIEYIHAQLVAARDRGQALLMVSTELDEIMGLADRILVMFRGKIVAERRPEDTSVGELGLLMAGIDAPPAAMREEVPA